MENFKTTLRCWMFMKPLRILASKIPLYIIWRGRSSDDPGTVSTAGIGHPLKRLMNKGNTVAKVALVVVAMCAVAACFTNTANADGTWVKDKETCREKGERPCIRQKYYEFSKDDSTLQQRQKKARLAREYKDKQLPSDPADRKKVKDARDFCRQHGMGRDCSNYNWGCTR